MNHDEILQAAKEADACHDDVCITPYMYRFAAIIEKRTIERCAAVCEKKWRKESSFDSYDCAAAIRKLGEQ